jgi:hypothetical protein
VASSYMAHVTYIPCPGCLLLDPSLYPSLALRRLKRDVGITDVDAPIPPIPTLSTVVSPDTSALEADEVGSAE